MKNGAYKHWRQYTLKKNFKSLLTACNMFTGYGDFDIKQFSFMTVGMNNIF